MSVTKGYKGLVAFMQVQRSCDLDVVVWPPDDQTYDVTFNAYYNSFFKLTLFSKPYIDSEWSGDRTRHNDHKRSYGKSSEMTKIIHILFLK